MNDKPRADSFMQQSRWKAGKNQSISEMFVHSINGSLTCMHKVAHLTYF